MPNRKFDIQKNTEAMRAGHRAAFAEALAAAKTPDGKRFIELQGAFFETRLSMMIKLHELANNGDDADDIAHAVGLAIGQMLRDCTGAFSQGALVRLAQGIEEGQVGNSVAAGRIVPMASEEVK